MARSKIVKNLKFTFILLIFFYFSFHFILPSVFFWKFGYRGTYDPNVFDFPAMKTGFMLNFVSLLLGAIAILFTPIKSMEKPIWKEKNSLLFLILSLFFTMGVFLTNNNYHDALKTLYTRQDFWVLGEMFFNIDIYILFAMTYSFNFISESQLAYVFIKILAASRSAPLVLLHYGMCAFVSPIFKRYRNKYIVYLCISFLFAIFGFNWATKIRNEKITNEIANAPAIHTLVQKAAVVDNGLMYQIMGRVSYLENTMLPIHYKNDEARMAIFKDKYSPVRQIQLLINNVVPGNVFEFDVYPNQYFRAAFMDFTLKRALEFYTSINVTLPVYFYMYTNFYISCLLAAASIWLYFITTSTFFKVHPLLGMCWLVTFYPGLLTFFDIVTIGKSLVVLSISTGLFLFLAKIDLKKIIGSWGRVEQ